MCHKVPLTLLKLNVLKDEDTKLFSIPNKHELPQNNIIMHQAEKLSKLYHFEAEDVDI
jgi:hypothetical protein